MTLHLRVVSQSDVGLVRKNNQDSGYASPHLLVVADGMGGAAAGDLASAVAVDVVKGLDTPSLRTDAAQTRTTAEPLASETEDTIVVPRPGQEQPEQGAAGRNPLLGRFAAAIAEANARIADLVAADYNLEGMGTTVTGALFDGDRLAVAHIGDSRAYLLRDGHLERLTHDHSWVQSLVDEGKIAPEEAAYHPHRSLLLKVLNGQPANDPDLTSVELRAGDRILFCSDGLCGMVDDHDIARLAATPDLDDAVADLVDAALAAGGIDNITVILADVLEGPDAVAGAAPAVADDEDTAIRDAVGSTATAGLAAAGGAVLGAALERHIPVVPRRRSGPPAPGVVADDDAAEDEDAADEDDGHTESGGAASPPTPPTRPDDESRYAPRPPARRRVARTLLVGLVVLLIAAAGLGAGYAWTRSQYFVGASDGQVAIFQGLPDGIPGLPLSQVYEVQELPVASLPPYYQAQVTAGIEVASLEAAHATVEQLREAARRCAEPSATPKPTPSTTPKPTGSASPRQSPSSGASATASVTAVPRPTPSTSTTPLPGQGC